MRTVEWLSFVPDKKTPNLRYLIMKTEINNGMKASTFLSLNKKHHEISVIKFNCNLHYAFLICSRKCENEIVKQHKVNKANISGF